MTPEQLRQIDELYQAARAASDEERAALLANAELGVRREVESRLAPRLRDATVTMLTSGARLGPYQIESKLGEGGMGEVYRAVDTRLGRAVAIKISHQQFSERFEREGRAISSLNHPNICTIYDVGPNYLVMELVEGETIAEILKRGPLSGKVALRYGVQIVAALGEAHGKGIIHRDLKPGNIMITKSGVKVLDFGLAKSEQDETITASRMVVGTPAYMAPEQREGKPADARSDIYSFGCVLYEMLTGQRAASARNPLASRRLEKIVGGCLRADAAHRWRSAAELERELNATMHRDKRWNVIVPAVAAVLLILAAGYIYLHRAPKLTDKDTLVLADFTNTTGDPVFDETLRQGLAVQLEQSPFLSLIPEERIQSVKTLMGQPADARLIPAIAREICERTGSAAVLEGGIHNMGSQYVLGLRAKNCLTGEVLDEEQATAPRKEEVLNALGRIASKFRNRVGESLATVKQHDTPLEEASTPYLEALRAYSAASRRLNADKDLPGAVPLFSRAIEIDPKFAMAYASLGLTYGFLGEPALSAENARKAYEMRNRASDRERSLIEATYQLQVMGNLEKARQICESWAQTYPREVTPYGLLGAMVYPILGKYDKGVEAARQLVVLSPDFPIAYLQLSFNAQFFGDLGEAEKALKRAADRKLEIPELLVQRYDLAFLKGDQAEMDRALNLGRGKPEGADMLADRKAFVLAYSGHLRDAKKVARDAADLNQEPAQRGRKALIVIGPALWDAFFDNLAPARLGANAAADLSKDRDVEYGAAFALALAGESVRSLSLAKDLNTRFPQDTAVQFIYLPAIRALLELNRGPKGEPSKAIELLQAARPYDRGAPPSDAPMFFGNFYTVYVRGLAYLAAHQGAEAAAEFQTVIDGRNIVVSDPIGALGHLQLARAFAMSGDNGKAKSAYRDFLNLWKEADRDIPVFQQAKAAFDKLP